MLKEIAVSANWKKYKMRNVCRIHKVELKTLKVIKDQKDASYPHHLHSSEKVDTILYDELFDKILGDLGLDWVVYS